MPDLKLIRNPGYVYDLIFLFYYQFNLDLFPEKFDATEEDMKYFAEQIKTFEPVSKDLYIFFRLPSSGRCFFTTSYFHPYSSVFTTEYDLAFLQKELNDHGTVIKNVLNHYFDGLNEKEVNECLQSNKYLFDRIKKSDYDDTFKTKLYEFFIDPESYIRLLQYELMTKEIQLSSYYEKNYYKILERYNELSCELLEEKFAFLGHDLGGNMNRSNVNLSFCLLNRRLVQFRFQQESMLYLIGFDYLSSIELLRKKHIELIPEQFGAALSDASRIKILDMILQKGECTCKEIEAALEMPASTTYHHVSTLEKCGVVKARIVKKSMFYSINRKYFSSVIEYFKKFSDFSEK